MTTDTTPQENIEAAVKELGLTFEYKFVPFSQSRNKAEEHPSLNWLVTLKRGNGSMSFDYSAGCGHCPSYKQLWNATPYEKRQQRELLAAECETGKQHNWAGWMSIPKPVVMKLVKPITPKHANIIHSLAIDASVLDSGSFEEWASEFGYEADSRAAEAIYNACLQQALQLRRLVGDEGLRLLQTASQDY